MKHDDLRAIAHNIADSLASGYSALSGYYGADVFGEAATSPQSYLTVDFLAGKVTEGTASEYLSTVIARYRDVLPDFCTRNGAALSDFRQLTARFSDGRRGKHMIITVEDSRGRQSTTEYVGMPGRRIKVIDSLGRVRTRAN
ncbi:hypothetical protein [Mesorhizobium sp. NZP2077]|uniref:hypothetical protein n=1 Tax=Mesorhizobium sp. NZP2077 TaxID=2483404 RepID=UPI0015559659|nr:hypothetical protein [Mesorhizobium sp. NZP2077]QKD16232.1 hypothetical protein HGP13_14750 [Mesorhizobium sp. NZP2077]